MKGSPWKRNAGEIIPEITTNAKRLAKLDVR